LDAINLASQVRDGDKVLVPAATNGDGPPGAGTTEERVNLNSATVAELETLPGIGPALAERIVAYREQHGPFRTVKDVQKVPGIGPAKFEGLADLVTV
jgi:competence protein ComEA